MGKGITINGHVPVGAKSLKQHIMTKIDELDREQDLALILFHHANEVEGVTRLQKLLFLLEKETDITNLHENLTFNFEPYKYGPFSDDVYDTIRFLLSIGALEMEDTTSPVDKIRDEGDHNELTNKRFVLTEKGRKISREVNSVTEDDLEVKIWDLVDEYCDLSLDELIEYVYNQYPSYTKNSEIKDEVLK